jgi:uridine kinase
VPEYTRFINNVEDINRMARQNPAKLVALSDGRFHKSVEEVAKKTIARGCRVVLLAGPSSSGKTTTAHLLSDALRQLGHETQMISLDDFYRPENEAPRREDGTRDFECLDALRVDCIQQCLRDLAVSNSCEVPQFDFVHHCPMRETRHLELSKDGVAVIEGLHALNPVLTKELPHGAAERVYISVKQDVCTRSEILLQAREVRMIRRIVRDYNFRGTSPERTLKMWNSVMEGEHKYIRPFREDADFTVNSFHAYELGVLRTQALMLLRGVREPSGWIADQVQRLSFALMLFAPISSSLLPPTSLIREFVGGGLYT